MTYQKQITEKALFRKKCHTKQPLYSVVWLPSPLSSVSMPERFTTRIMRLLGRRDWSCPRKLVHVNRDFPVTRFYKTQLQDIKNMRKRYTETQIVSKLRQADVLIGKGTSVPEVCRETIVC